MSSDSGPSLPSLDPYEALGMKNPLKSIPMAGERPPPNTNTGSEEFVAAKPGDANWNPNMLNFRLRSAIVREEQAKAAGERASLRDQIRASTDLDTLVKQDFLLQISNSKDTTSDIATRFSEAVNPEGATFKEFSKKKATIAQIADTPGIDRQTMLTAGLAPQQSSLLTGNVK